jgi:hypothetical protein
VTTPSSNAPGIVFDAATNTTIGATGSKLFVLPPGSKTCKLLANLTVAPGTSVAFTLQEVDPVDGVTANGTPATLTLSSKASGNTSITVNGIAVLLSWVCTGTCTGINAWIGAQA